MTKKLLGRVSWIVRLLVSCRQRGKVRQKSTTSNLSSRLSSGVTDETVESFSVRSEWINQLVNTDSLVSESSLFCSCSPLRQPPLRVAVR